MPFVVSCAACGKRLNIPDKLYEEKIRGHVVTIACKGCGADIKVDGTRPREEVDLSAVEAKTGAAGSPGSAAASAAVPAAAAPPAAAASAVTPAAAAPPAVAAPRAGGTPPGAAPARAAAGPAQPGPVAASATPGTKAGGAPAAGPTVGGQPAAGTAPAALPGLGGLPKPGAARAPLAPRPATGSSPQAAATAAVTPTAAGAGREPVAPGKDFARMTFPGTPAAMGRGGAGPAAQGRGFQPVVARPGALDRPSDPGAEASAPTTAIAEPPARRRGVPIGLRRTAPESPAARLTDPEASTAPTTPPTPHEGAAEGKGTADLTAAGAVSDWLWAVSFADDDDRELTFAEVKAAILARQVDAETIAWREGLSDWLPLGEIDVFRSVFAELARSPAPPRAGAKPAVTIGGGAPATAASPEAKAAPAVGKGAPTGSAATAEPPTRPAAGPVAGPVAPVELAAGETSAAGTSPAPDAGDDREDWRRSTADLLAELAGGAQQLRPGLPVGAAPVAPDPESLPPLPRPPAAPKFSLPPSLMPPRSASRVIAYVVVALLVVAALAGIVLLVSKGLAPSDDPTLRPVAAPAVRPSVAASASSARVTPLETSAAMGPSSTPATYGSSGADLARIVRENVDRSGGSTGTPFDERTAREVLAEAAGRAALCRKPEDEKGPAKAAVTFDPATGRPSDVRLLGRYAGTGSGACIVATLRAVRTKRYSGEPVTLEQTVMLR